MKLILIFSVLLLLACETIPNRTEQESSNCIDTGENIECQSENKTPLRQEAVKESLNFEGMK